MKNKQLNNIILRVLFLFFGCLSLIAGCIGIFLPILPTVPFFLLTAFCFAKGSKKFHDWFLATSLYKKYMSGVAEHHCMTLKGELFLLGIVSLMLIAATYFANVLAMSIVIPILIACKYAYFIFKITPVDKEELELLKKQKEALGND